MREAGQSGFGAHRAVYLDGVAPLSPSHRLAPFTITQSDVRDQQCNRLYVNKYSSHFKEGSIPSRPASCFHLTKGSVWTDRNTRASRPT